MTTRLLILIIAFGLFCGFVGYVILPPDLDMRTAHPQWFRERRVIDVDLSVADAENAQPIADATIAVFDHRPERIASVRKMALDAEAYDVETFSTGADGSCRIRRFFPLFDHALQASKENMDLPETWVKVSAPGRAAKIVPIRPRPLMLPRNPGGEQPLAVSVALPKAAD
jgi:hypothetical protein